MPQPEGIASPTSMKLVVSDLARAEAFYRSICEFKPARHLHFSLAGRPFTEVILRETDGAGSVTLMAYDDNVDPPVPGNAVQTFSTNDLSAFARLAVSAGGTEIAKPRGLRLGKWNALLGEFADPDGNLLQVLQTLEEEV